MIHTHTSMHGKALGNVALAHNSILVSRILHTLDSSPDVQM